MIVLSLLLVLVQSPAALCYLLMFHFCRNITSRSEILPTYTLNISSTGIYYRAVEARMWYQGPASVLSLLSRSKWVEQETGTNTS